MHQHTNAEKELIEAEKLNDEAKFTEVFRKTFITEKPKVADNDETWSLSDMQIPMGQLAKLIRIYDPANPDFRITEVADRLKFIQPTPVIILAGAMTGRAGKTLAGVARSAFNTGSILIDSGIGSQIEKFAMRRGVKLVGVCPEAQVRFPKIQNKSSNELTNGHTHFFLIGKDDGDRSVIFQWGEESRIKYDLAQRISKGRSTKIMGASSLQPCKMVTVVLGDNEPSALRDIEASLNAKIPLVVIRGSDFCNQICDQLEEKHGKEVPRHQPSAPVWGATKNQVMLRLIHSG